MSYIFIERGVRMNKEINTIIANLDGCIGMYDYGLTPKASNLLVSYIEELQQENQQLKNNINKLQKELNEENLQCSKYSIELNNLKQENKILKENAEHNDKVVDKVNWENMLLKGENKQLKDNWDELKKDIGYELLKLREPNEYNKGLCNAFTYINSKIQELEQGSENGG